jgi:hypothetical protein
MIPRGSNRQKIDAQMFTNGNKLAKSGGVAASVFILSALYLFISRGGLSSLASLRTLIFFVTGVLLTAVIIGLSAELLQRSLSKILWNSITNPLSPQAIGRINAIGGAILIVWQIVVTFLFTVVAYQWFILYFVR